jgi:hypothetical protein
VIKIIHQSDRDAWLEARKPYVTASLAAALFDDAESGPVCPDYYNVRTRADLVRLKCGLMDETSLGAPGEIRSRLERFLAEEFAGEHGLTAEPFGWLVQDQLCSRLAATPDAIVRAPAGIQVAADFKVVRSMAPEHCKPLTAKGKPSQQAFLHGLPLYHQLQLQCQMACLGNHVKSGVLLVLHLAPDLELKAYWVDRHEAVIDKMRRRALEVFAQVEEYEQLKGAAQ